MLTRLEALSSIDFDQGRLIPDRLSRVTHAHYVELARQMLVTYRHGIGRTRRELHHSIAHVLSDEQDCPVRRVAAFCKLLDDASDYERDIKAKAAELRRKVFRMAAEFHPLVREPDRLFETAEDQVKLEIARRLGRDWDEIDQELYADIIDFHRLKEFSGPLEPTEFLSRYNVAQVQAALYGAVSLTVRATSDFKTILRYAKLARLIHVITRVDERTYLFQFSGPASLLHETRRYGVQFAKFLPSLLACRNWQMRAIVPVGQRGWRVRLELSDEDGLRSHLPAPAEFDSDLEQLFADEWGDEPRDGWSLLREASILTQGQKTFVPDFEFRHADGRRVLLEVIGYWTPEYLQKKAETLRLFASQQVLLAVAKSVHEQLPELASEPILFGKRLRVKAVLERLAQLT
ncbi:MAG: DUF790 family protein [Planctomycetota bacterium]